MKKRSELETKVDLLFSVVSHNFLANQAMQVVSSIGEEARRTEDEKERKALTNVMDKALESYKHHSKNVNDAIGYFYELFGEESNANIVSLLKKKGLTEPAPVSEIEVGSEKKSE